RVESSDDEGLGEEDTSKQGRIIDDLDADEDVVVEQEVVATKEMFDVDKDLQGKEVVVEQEVVANKEPIVNVAQVSAAATTVTIDNITLAKALKALKTSKPKIKGIVIKDHEEPKKAKFFMELLEKRRNFSAAKRAEEKRNKPPTKAQQSSIMCTYLKNMEGYKLNCLKNKSFADIQDLFDKAMKRVNTFVDYITELVEESSKKVEVDITHEES
nr:hypothetical protein [Tanacetum cinerariifolium]